MTKSEETTFTPEALEAFDEQETARHRVYRLEDFFFGHEGAGHAGWDQRMPFSLKSFCDAAYAIDVAEELIDETEDGLSPEDAHQFFQEIRKTLEWFVEHDYLRLVGNDVFVLAENGIGILGVKH